MRNYFLARVFVFIGMFFVVSANAASTSKIESLGDDTFAITRTGKTAFDRDVAGFQREAQEEAAKYCADQGKVLKVVSTTSDRPAFSFGYASAKVIFKALNGGDPQLTETPTGTVAGQAKEMDAPKGILPTHDGDFYSELLKLDDLRKRGLLNDKEFERQKKRLLKNYK